MLLKIISIDFFMFKLDRKFMREVINENFCVSVLE